MDKAVLRNFAIESRKDLMEKIDRKIKLFYVDEEFKKDNRGDVIVLSNDKHTLTLTKDEDSNRDKLLKRIVELGYDQVVEEAAYTWFNRIIAIRYMEIHDYLPLTINNQSLNINVLSSKDNKPEPEILKFSNLTNSELDIDFDKEKYSELKDENDKYKYILLLVCKKLGKVIPQVFNGITDYIDLLIPENLLKESGFIYKLLQQVDIESFNRVEIVGWLYQYYISDKKDDVFAKMKDGIKISKENVPSATQLFTPNWIVKYMTENTIGKELTDKKLNFKINNKIEKHSLENLHIIDPCCGSGHILVEAFSLLYDVYMERGYSKSEIPKMIIENNLYGIDLDERASQLSILALLLKAREIDKNIFSKNIKVNVIDIRDSNYIFKDNLYDILDSTSEPIIDYVLKAFEDAKEYGSILKLDSMNYDYVIDKIKAVDNIFSNYYKNEILPLFIQAKLLSQKYNYVITNPPYMGSKGMSPKLLSFVKKKYPNSKNDLFSVFIERCREFCIEKGYYAMITPTSFLSLGSYEKLRHDVISNNFLESILYMGRGIFGIDFGSTSFVIKNEKDNNSEGIYFKLFDRTFQYIDVEEIKSIFLESLKNDDYECDFSKYESKKTISNFQKTKFIKKPSDFLNMPGNVICFWLNDELIKAYKNNDNFDKIGHPSTGMLTANNDKYLRLWWEINYNEFIDKKTYKNKWIKYLKGGSFRKWYGNLDYLLFYNNDPNFILQQKNSTVLDLSYLNKIKCTWSDVSSGVTAFRIAPTDTFHDKSGHCFYPDEKNQKWLLGYANTNFFQYNLKIFNQTIHCQAGDVAKIVCPNFSDSEKEKITNLVSEIICLEKEDWDSNETSWDFSKLSYICNGKLSTILDKYKKDIENQFKKVKDNEEDINRIVNKYFNTINMDNVEDSLISMRKFNSLDEIKRLISYSVGCMFGRYSLNNEGLNFAGGVFAKNIYKDFKPDDDNIIPISDNENIYYNDDIVGKFKEFIKCSFGSENLNSNLDYIAEILGKRGTESSEDTIRRYFVNDFFNDHVKTYQKRPIYWLFDSGKKNGFKCLIYLHRYDEQIVSKIRTKYLHNTLSIYQRTVEEIDYKLNNEELSTTDKRELQNKKVDLNGKITECNEYEEMVGNVANKMIKLDLDDGVVVNYSKFIDDNGKSILAKIK